MDILITLSYSPRAVFVRDKWTYANPMGVEGRCRRRDDDHRDVSVSSRIPNQRLILTN